MWWERAREMRRWASARWVVVRAGMFVKIDDDGVARTMNVLCAMVFAGWGNSGQRALNAGASDGWLMFILQWCAPLRRQHAGRWASMSCPIASSGATVGRPKTVSNNHVRTRRICDEFSRNGAAIRGPVSDLRCANLVRPVLEEYIEITGIDA